MPGRDGHASGHWGNGPRGRISGAVLFFAALTRTLEAESDRLSLWIPVLFAGGILIYFGLPEEPRLLSAAAVVMAAAGIYLAGRGAGLGLVVGGAALALAAGFATAKLHTEMARAPVLTKEMRGVTVKGWVELYEPRDKSKARITLRVIALGELPPEETPYRVRVTLPAANAKIATGEAVSLKATLRPPPEPIVPHGFDFGRTAWFDRLGATGYSTGKIDPLAGAGEPPLGLQFWAAIDSLRSLVNARIRASLPGERGEIAAALITGERAGISAEVNQAMRNSGLFHILSISGLHMVIMAGTVFWLVRAALALIPSIALRYPIRKWAAGGALAAALFYLLLSGAAVPTVRSWIMMSIVLFAMILDRPALTMRNVAFAALLILLVAPASLFDPSFEMSFAAVVGLVALVEANSKRVDDGVRDVSFLWRGLRRLWAIAVADVVTTLVATAAVAPFAIYHFHRMSHYGVVANLLALPLIGLLIMPFALASLLAMPFGIEAWPLQVMGLGIDLLVATGKWVASWPGSVSVLPSISGRALLLIVLGGLWLCLWQTRWRALGLVIVAAGLLVSGEGTKPDVLVERDGRNVALRSEDGTLALPPATRANYSVDNWLLADGEDRDAEEIAANSPFRCDLLGCIGKVKGKTIALIRHPAALEEDCRIADIVIAPFSVGKGCSTARVVVDRRALQAEGAHAIYIEGLSIRSESVAETRGRRPWVPERQIAKPTLLPGQAYAKDQGAADNNAEDGRFDGDPDE
ncbi:ComEC/Rec2 family competence protein [Methyloceanibacter sp.]|uniref:ComEC/Rec2 family competence protein n=1 Tax=Methyloceanibacter sp. TaxID=1965321 RepID=UPI003D6CCDC1